MTDQTAAAGGVELTQEQLADIKEDAYMGRFVWKELSIVAVTAVFSILATISVSSLTAGNPITEADVRSIIKQESVDRTAVLELLDDKALTRKDRDDIYARLRALEQQYTRIETKLDLLLSRTVPANEHIPLKKD